MKLSQPVPELPVLDVAAAQAYYRDHLGFEIAWLTRDGDIGAVSHGDSAIFFRRSDGPIHPGTFWMFADDVEAALADLTARGANIIAPIEDKPWGLRQFTVADLHGHTFHIHHDL